MELLYSRSHGKLDIVLVRDLCQSLSCFLLVVDIEICKLAEDKQINFRYYSDEIGISLDETTTEQDLINILNLFANQEDSDPPKSP